MTRLSETREQQAHHDREAVLFTSAVRALGTHGFSTMDFDIGGKKARRRYVSSRTPAGDDVIIWVKSSTYWPNMAEAVRFPWKKLPASPDGHAAVAVACEAAARRGATHFLAVAGNDQTAALSVARLYPLAQLPELVAQQAAIIDSVFYRAHSAALIIHAYAPEYYAAADLANSAGQDILSPRSRPKDARDETLREVVRGRSIFVM